MDSAAAETGEETARGKDPASAGMRRCAITREDLPRSSLIRFVVGPDGALVPDFTEKLPGRGTWVQADGDLLAAALADGRLLKAASRAADSPVSIDPDLVEHIESALSNRLGDLIGLANRSAQIVMGHEKVRDFLRKGDAALLIVANDASVDQTAKLTALQPKITKLQILTREELSLALGRENVVHAALKSGGLARRIGIDAGRLAGFRCLDDQGALKDRIE